MTLGMDNSFTIEVWISLDSNKTTGPYPVMCTAEGTICLSIEGGRVVGRYGTAVVTSSISLTADTWYNIIFRHRIEDESISIFIDAANVGATTGVQNLNFTNLASSTDLTMYIGRQNTTYFRGTIDEVRIYNEGIQDNEITMHVSLDSIDRPVLKSYGTLHLRMEDSASSSSLINSGLLSGTTAKLSGPVFVTSFQQLLRFKITYPNNR